MAKKQKTTNKEIAELLLNAVKKDNYLGSGNGPINESNSVFAINQPGFENIALRISSHDIDRSSGDMRASNGLKFLLKNSTSLRPISPIYKNDRIGQPLLQLYMDDRSMPVTLIRREPGISLDQLQRKNTLEIHSIKPHIEALMQQVARLAYHTDRVLDIHPGNVVYDPKHGMVMVDSFKQFSRETGSPHERAASALESVVNMFTALADNLPPDAKQAFESHLKNTSARTMQHLREGSLPKLDKTSFAEVSSTHAVALNNPTHVLKAALANIQKEAGITR